MDTWNLFSVTPIGIALMVTGITYFVVAGKYVLPNISSDSKANVAGSAKYLEEVYGVDYMLFEATVPEDSPLVGQVPVNVPGQVAAIYPAMSISPVTLRSVSSVLRRTCATLSINTA